ncbi:TetR family transcriptional regulator [Sphaerisporangium rufum]|uniref:TetR family transcriptional regulator n=1 Tax=Sphaerisporangium rufum TaxID=1381558 RepID=A0A919R1U1_9ACTN|nr:TetR/AcrR family transcriptional regulator [Sphaerisporangium rufum]GII78186.1 TetR family transcriptional regulator [Sphaerisporangium rufum]
MGSAAPLGLQGAYTLGSHTTRDALRNRLIEVAGGLLVTDGADSLTVRRIAAEAGCATTVVYTMFGNKEGLAEALYLEGFERFRRRLDAVPRHPDPLEYLISLGGAYREACLAEPAYYSVMFEKAIPGFEPSERARTLARAAVNVLDRAVADCISAGRLVPTQPRKIADCLWAAAHGAVSLERAGHLRDDHVYTSVTLAAINRYLVRKDQLPRSP